MKLGGPVFGWTDPLSWVQAHRDWGYGAAYFPSHVEDPIAYARSAHDAGLVIAEVGVWNNVLSPDEETRRTAVDRAIEMLQLAELVGARCCVNIAGSRGHRWDGPHAADLAPDSLDLVAESVRTIIDAVNPTNTKYSLETMPYMHPDSVESALKLIDAVDRPAFGIHFDPVNLINSPRRFFENGAFVEDFVSKLAGHITAVHLKDIVLEPKLTVHLQEVRPGLGHLDMHRLFLAMDKYLDPAIPALLEHLPSEEEYRLANEYVRSLLNGG